MSQTDAEMIGHYESKKSYFAALVSGVECDVDESRIIWRHKESEVNSACSELLAKAEVDGIGLDPFSKGVMLFQDGYSYSSHQKAYIYAKKELTPQYASLDLLPEGLQPYQMGFRKIDKNWYISYEYVN